MRDPGLSVVDKAYALPFLKLLPATSELTSRMTALWSFSGRERTCWNFFQSRLTSGSSRVLEALGGVLRPRRLVGVNLEGLGDLDDGGRGRELGDGLVGGDRPLARADLLAELSLSSGSRSLPNGMLSSRTPTSAQGSGRGRACPDGLVR